MRKTSRYALFALLLGTAVAALAVYMAPDNSEIALMQMSDRDFDQALKKFSGLHDAGNHSIDVVAPLINLSIYYGDLDKSIALLNGYLDDHPKSVEARRRLAELYKSSQRLNNYCAELEDLQKLSPSTENLRNLADTYDFLGRSQDEMNALTRLVARRDYKPNGEDFIKLATFLRTTGHPDDAIKIMRGYIVDQNYKVELDAPGLAISLLLEQGQTDKAQELAIAYAKKSGNPSDAVNLASQFEEKHQADAASAVLQPFAAAIAKSPELEQKIIDVMLAQNKSDDVYKLLIAQNDSGSLPDLVAPSLIDLALTRKNYDLAAHIINKTDLAGLPEDALLRYAGFTQQAKQPVLAGILRDRLGAAYLQKTPLLNAILALAIQDTPETLRDLQAVPTTYIASPCAHVTVASIYLSHGMSKNALDLLNSTPLPDMLDMLGAVDLATFYLEADKADEGTQQLASVRPSSTPQIQATIDNTLLLMDVGQGKLAAAEQRAQAYSDKDKGILVDAYDFAQRYNQKDVALSFARRLYMLAPSLSARLELAEALTQSGKFADALGYLQAPSEQDAESRHLYMNTLADWIEKAGIKSLPEAQKKEAEKLLLTVLQTMHLDDEERLGYAYLFEDMGRFDQAEKIYVKAAGDGAYGAHNVKELLGFWQDHPSSVAREWIESRARRASGNEKAEWLTALNERGDSASVLILAQNEWKSSPAIADQYVAALIETHEHQKLADALLQMINEESDARRLKQLTSIAVQEDIPTVAGRGWAKVYQADPSDSDAQLELGMAAYDAEHNDKAEPLLGAYLRNNPGTYIVNYAYGEILQDNGKYAEAKPYLEHALQELQSRKELNQEETVDEAHLLLYTGKSQQALALFHQLVDKYPQDKALRADLAETLMEAGQYDEASHLLSR
jgi:thioredoxin-like negative regulator of GroEL